MSVSHVNCLFCSHPPLDFQSYSRHMMCFHQVKSGSEVLLALQFLEKEDRASLVENTKAQVINFRGNKEAKEVQDETTTTVEDEQKFVQG